MLHSRRTMWPGTICVGCYVAVSGVVWRCLAVCGGVWRGEWRCMRTGLVPALEEEQWDADSERVHRRQPLTAVVPADDDDFGMVGRYPS